MTEGHAEDKRDEKNMCDTCDDGNDGNYVGGLRNAEGGSF